MKYIIGAQNIRWKLVIVILRIGEYVTLITIHSEQQRRLQPKKKDYMREKDDIFYDKKNIANAVSTYRGWKIVNFGIIFIIT